MAKSLGQIHVANFEVPVSAGGDSLYLDLPRELTKQLQQMVRAGTYHKVTGIDIGIDTQGTTGGGQVTGKLYYYAPTKGRCEVFRGAFAAMRNVFKMQGISMRDNLLYDFKAPLDDLGTNSFSNQATLDGTTGLCLYNSGDAAASIFDVHNASVKPQNTASNPFQTGFDTVLSEAYMAATGAPNKPDFVLNDEAVWTGNDNYAATLPEYIPFALSWTPDNTDLAMTVEWRPDPALYLAVLCGQFRLEVEEIELDSGNVTGLNLQVAIHVAGWKSIMGDPDKKKSSSRGRSSSRNNRSHSDSQHVKDLKEIVGTK